MSIFSTKNPKMVSQWDPQMDTKIVKFHQNVVLETTPQAGIKNNTQKVRFWSLLGRVERGSSA